MRYALATLGSLALAAALGVVALGAGSPPAAQFTAAQASSGHTTYLIQCSGCHGADLAGVYGPALAGAGSNIPYLPPSFVYDYTSVYMPAGNAGALKEQEYVNVVAYLMQQNGRRASGTALTVKAAQNDQTPMAPR